MKYTHALVSTTYYLKQNILKYIHEDMDKKEFTARLRKFAKIYAMIADEIENAKN